LAAVLGFWLVGMYYGLHFIFWWYDAVAHFAGGAWVAALAIAAREKLSLELNGQKTNLVWLLAVLGFVALVGVLWEFFELVLDRYILYNGFTYLPGVYEDTLLDLFMDLVGGAAFYCILLLMNRFRITNS